MSWRPALTSLFIFSALALTVLAACIRPAVDRPESFSCSLEQKRKTIEFSSDPNTARAMAYYLVREQGGGGDETGFIPEIMSAIEVNSYATFHKSLTAEQFCNSASVWNGSDEKVVGLPNIAQKIQINNNGENDSWNIGICLAVEKTNLNQLNSQEKLVDMKASCEKARQRWKILKTIRLRT